MTPRVTQVTGMRTPDSMMAMRAAMRSPIDAIHHE